MVLALPAAAGTVVRGAGGFRFVEPFNWSGVHAATLDPGDEHGPGVTYWWDEDSWDVHADTNIASISGGKGFSTSIHRAGSSDLRDGSIQNGFPSAASPAASSGIGVMEIDF